VIRALIALMMAAVCLGAACSEGGPSVDAGRERPRFDRGVADRATEARADLAGESRRDLRDLDLTCDASLIGKPCTAGGGGCDGHPCVLTGGAGFCSCACTPDDPQTPLVNEDSCPRGRQHLCALLPLAGGGSGSFCARTCTPRLGGSDCQAPLACQPESSGLLALPERALCVARGCAADSDCPVLTATACSAAQPCPGSQSCAPAPGGARCALPGSCDLASGLCTTHGKGLATAAVGDPCEADTDCAGSMQCLLEQDQAALRRPAGAACASAGECCSGRCAAGHCAAGLCPVLYRHGYCTISGCAFVSSLPARACPQGATCNRTYAGGLCQRVCSLASAASCRGHAGDLLGDYECRAWSNLYVAGQPLSLEPVCDFGPLLRCDALQSSGLDCSAVGVDEMGKPNVTNMGCRSLDGKPTALPSDPDGLCLDDTASGPTP